MDRTERWTSISSPFRKRAAVWLGGTIRSMRMKAESSARVISVSARTTRSP